MWVSPTASLDPPPTPDTINFFHQDGSDSISTHRLVTSQAFRGTLAAGAVHHVSALILILSLLCVYGTPVKSPRWGNTTQTDD